MVPAIVLIFPTWERMRARKDVNGGNNQDHSDEGAIRYGILELWHEAFPCELSQMVTAN